LAFVCHSLDVPARTFTLLQWLGRGKNVVNGRSGESTPVAANDILQDDKNIVVRCGHIPVTTRLAASDYSQS
jgi:hypothetical protein